MSEARVDVDGVCVGAIGAGLLVYLGAGKRDRESDPPWMAEKLATLRIFHDDAGKMARSAIDVAAEVLVVSQFTLYGDAGKGRRPTWQAAAPGPVSEPLYDAFCAALTALGAHVERGVFGAHMRVESVNEGPFTVLLER